MKLVYHLNAEEILYQVSKFEHTSMLSNGTKLNTIIGGKGG